MNLLERLKPEILESINFDAEKFPHYVEHLKNELEKNYSFLYLSINTGSNVCMHANKDFNILELSKCFIDEK
jgi:hypothetical protein